ncbi:MAG: ComF family protein [Chitinophagia bacterium]|nr:ComF family protein [Chitinophagia bacterium]
MLAALPLRQWYNSLLGLLYPTLCEGCGSALVGNEEVLCIACEADLPETGYHQRDDNETCMRFSGRVPFGHATSLAWFTPNGLLQHLVHGMKYAGKQQIAGYMGYLLGIRLRETQWITTVDAIVPVPLHLSREQERGYNQSALIAAGIARATGIKTDMELLTRNRRTESQTNKSRTERVSNMAGAFTVNGVGNRDIHILLVDDVLTTGATLEACATTLLQAGITKISFATIGIAAS